MKPKDEPLSTVPLSPEEIKWLREMLTNNGQGEHPLTTNEIQVLRGLVRSYKQRKWRRMALTVKDNNAAKRGLRGAAKL